MGGLAPLPSNSISLRMPVGGDREVRARWGNTYLRPKDSNATVRVHNCATQKVPEVYQTAANKNITCDCPVAGR